MALGGMASDPNRKVMYTDTNTGVNSTTGKYTPSTTGNANNVSTGTVNYPKATTPTAADRQAGRDALAQRMATTPTATKTATTPVTQTATQQTYTPTYYGGGSGGGGGEEPSANYNLLTEWLKNYENSTNNQYTGQKDSANAYKTAAEKNLKDALNMYTNQYNTNNEYLNMLGDRNAQYQQNTLDAIEQAYNNSTGAARDYYGNLLNTYNRSMGWIDQGYNEGSSNAQKIRDEAVQLAQNLYDMEAAAQQRQTEKDLQGQYASYMNGMKNINQLLAAQGINGGASESTLLGMLTNYGNNRNSLDEARLAALGGLRQTQMQSDSAANTTYLQAMTDLINAATQNRLGVENNRSAGEANYANMLTNAENTRGSNLMSANNNFQNWAADLTGRQTDNNNLYASNYAGIQNSRNDVGANYQQMYDKALSDRTNNVSNGTYASILSNLAEQGVDYKSGLNTSNKTKAEQQATIDKKGAKVVKGTATKGYAKQSANIQKSAKKQAYKQVLKGKLKLNDIKDKALRKAVEEEISKNAKTNPAAKKAQKANTITKKASLSVDVIGNQKSDANLIGTKKKK